MRAVPAPITVGLLAFVAILAACTAAVTGMGGHVQSRCYIGR